jgi:hypothetical protein
MSKAHPKSKTKAVIPRYSPNGPSLFGPPPLLVGEDGAQYDDLFAAIRAAVKPVDTVDEMFVADVVLSVGGPALASPEIEPDPRVSG